MSEKTILDEIKKCKVNMVDDCVKVGLASTFHGKRCPVCAVAYKRDIWDNKEPYVVGVRYV